MAMRDYMINGYITAMKQASVDDGESLEAYDLSAAGFCAAACDAFLAVHGAELEAVIESNLEYSYSDAGHDLFLTREGHGVGFWDRNLGHYGDVFTKYSEGLCSCNPYVGDDQLIYMSAQYGKWIW